MRRNIGWMYSEPGAGATPNRIRVKIKADAVHETTVGGIGKAVEKVFDDNVHGAQEAEDFVTKTTGTDSWMLEYRIFIP